MTKWTRFFSALLTLALFLNMIPAANAAEGDVGKLSMTASGTAVTHGETVTVTVASKQAFTTRGAGMTISYDPAALEPILTDSKVKEGFRISGPMTVNGKTVLRISSFPGEEGRTVEVDEPLAVLAFRTLAPGDNIQVEMTAAYLYDENLSGIGLQKAEPVQFNIAPVPVTGITLDAETLDLETGESRALKAKVTPENASDKTITWTSSDETKVTVADGVLTALAITEEPVTITASVGGFTARCSVNVVYPPDAGYVVTMPRDQEAVVDDRILISPVIGNAREEVTGYNAYDITLSYDPAMLLLIYTEMEDITVTTGNGTVNLIHYGPDKDLGTAPFTLTFKALKKGETAVSVTAARVDHSENAVISNAAKALPDPGETKVSIGAYPVSLPAEFTGEPLAEPGMDYTFEAKDKFYDYTFDGSTMGGGSVAVRDNGDGTFTVEDVTGKLVIRTGKTGKTFEVVLGTDMTGNSTAQYMTDYTVTLHEDDDYVYSNFHVSINGQGYRDYIKSGSSYTIPGRDITGRIIFTVTKTEAGTPPPSTTWYAVSFEGSGAGAVTGHSASVAAGSSYTFALNKETGYRYSVTYKMGTEEIKTVRPVDGIYTIPKVDGDLLITVNKEIDGTDYTIEVYNYFTLDEGKTVYLVLVSGGLDDSKIYTYAETPMYYSDVYNAWCILTIETSKLTAGLAKKQIGMQPGQMDTLDPAAYDVNMTGLVDINDAQLAYDLYNGNYENFSVINMHRFLNADVNADRKITVADAAAIASAIK